MDNCNCPEVRALHYAYEKQWRYDQYHGRPRTVSAIGASRRIKALYAIGWSADELGKKLGVSTQVIHDHGQHLRTRMRVSTAERYRKLYEELSDTPGPSAVTAGRARKLNYVPPIGWDDDTIDDPAGQPWTEYRNDDPDHAAVLRIWQYDPPANRRRVDTIEFVRQAVNRGLTDAQVADHLNISAYQARTLRVSLQD